MKLNQRVHHRNFCVVVFLLLQRATDAAFFASGSKRPIFSSPSKTHHVNVMRIIPQQQKNGFSSLSLLLSTNSLIQLSQKEPKKNKNNKNGEHKRSKSVDTHNVINSAATVTTTKERTVVILYYKPPGIITSHSNADAISSKCSDDTTTQKRITVYEDIMSMKGFVSDFKNDGEMKNQTTVTNARSLSFQQATNIKSKLHAIGRLDTDTTGLLLLTNDGGLVHHVTNPTSATKKKDDLISKTYEALVMGYYNQTSAPIKQIQNKGVDIGTKYGGMTKPADSLTILSHPTAKSTLVSITISEGKNRQIRRMFHNVGSGVLKLHRSKIGNVLSLDGLKEGEWRVLSEKEIIDGLGWHIRDVDTENYKKGSKNDKKFEQTKRRRRRSR